MNGSPDERRDRLLESMGHVDAEDTLPPVSSPPPTASNAAQSVGSTLGAAAGASAGKAAVQVAARHVLAVKVGGSAAGGTAAAYIAYTTVTAAFGVGMGLVASGGFAIGTILLVAALLKGHTRG